MSQNVLSAVVVLEYWNQLFRRNKIYAQKDYCTEQPSARMLCCPERIHYICQNRNGSTYIFRLQSLQSARKLN